MAGSSVKSDLISDQCGHDDEMDGERFMKTFLDNVSIVSALKRCASGIACMMSSALFPGDTSGVFEFCSSRVTDGCIDGVLEGVG